MMKTEISNWRVAARTALLGFAALILANCASSDPRPVSALSTEVYRPAPGTAFTVYVRPGDTLSEIAERYRVKSEDIIAMNNITDPDRILSGDQLFVPAYGVGRPKVDETPIRQARSAPSRPATQNSNSAPVRRASYQPAPATPRQAPRANTPAQVPQSEVRFIWPVNGRVISEYGPGAGGQRNDGINIAAERGTPFRAAGAGTVTYVGNELRGFGNLLLIRHDNGYVTAYAHADRITVSRGDRVEAGQFVGYLGATGDVAEPQLHFEIRNGTRPVNPVAHLDNPRTNQASLASDDPSRS